MTQRDIDGRRARRVAWALFAGLVLVYNVNGREIGSFDSQPAKLTARELAVRGTLSLDHAVTERPGLGLRPGFARDRQGHVRSAYPLPSALFAAIPATLLHRTGVIDMDAPLAPNLVAAATASILTALACTLIFLALLHQVTLAAALVTSIGLGLGTNYWAIASQTLWQHESVAFGLALALWAYLRDAAGIRPGHHVAAGLGLALGAAARPQIAVMVLMMLAWVSIRTGRRSALIPAAAVLSAASAVTAANLWWFGHPLGAVAGLEALHPETHGVSSSFGAPWAGAAGLLVSPSRGLLIFSPILLVALAGLGPALRTERHLRWLAGAAALQFALYSSYSVWWAGHTYGPRYLLDILPPLAPFGAAGVDRLRSSRPARVVGTVLLAWSIGVAGLGALVYPNDEWNTRPLEVDRHHERLWDATDSQIRRAFDSGWSPQNFNLFGRDAIRRP